MVTAYFGRRPRAEIKADLTEFKGDDGKPKKTLTPVEVSRILRRRQETKVLAGVTTYADPENLDPVLRFHLRREA